MATISDDEIKETIPDKELEGWFSSMKTVLGTLNDTSSKVSSISYVPDQLRKSREEAYVPKVVSIGPLHRETSRELLYMEETKWRCMLSLLLRTEKPEKSFDNCGREILQLDWLVRASYTDDIKHNCHDLAKIMLLDGCFLLELVISNDGELDKKLPKSREKEKNPGAEFGKVASYLSDLKLLENQIPMFIISVLFQTLFRYDWNESQKIVNDSAMWLFGCSIKSSPVDHPINCAHILDLVHWFVTREEENNRPLSTTVDINEDFNSKSTKPKPPLQLKRCAARLEALGVTFVQLQHAHPEKRRSMLIRLEDGKEVIFGHDKKFSKSEGRLEIQPLRITETMEVQWRNLIAWEQNRITHEKFHRGKNQTPCKFSQYALLFRDLVCCEHDIQLLIAQQVLKVEDGKRSNKDLMTLFREIAKGIDVDLSGDECYRQLVNDLNAYSGAKGNRRMILWHRWKSIEASARYTCRDWLGILIRDHTPTVWKTLGVIAAVILLGLTIAQTILAAISL